MTAAEAAWTPVTVAGLAGERGGVAARPDHECDLGVVATGTEVGGLVRARGYVGRRNTAR